MTQKNFELRGTAQNPCHLSVATVLLNEQGEIAVIRKPRGYHCLPRETIYSDETLIQGLRRGLREELGVDCIVKRFLGSLVNHFNLSDGTNIEKTTLYFKAQLVGVVGSRSLEDDEKEDEVLWFLPNKAKNLIEGSRHIEGGKNEEHLMVVRAMG